MHALSSPPVLPDVLPGQAALTVRATSVQTKLCLGLQDRLPLPGGLEVICEEAGASEAAHIHAEIFQHRCYWHERFHLENDAVVLDIGANIGRACCCLAYLLVRRKFQPEGIVILTSREMCLQVLNQQLMHQIQQFDSTASGTSSSL